VTYAKSKTPEYKAWCSMRQRCLNKNFRDYPRWGGRGISICRRWDKFENFLTDMGPKPRNESGSRRAEFSLDRIDNDGNYQPSNCRWATRSQQAQNKSNNGRFKKLVKWKRRTQSVAAWAKEFKVCPTTIYNRINRKMPLEGPYV
jgi:hypothetical protein